MAEENQKNDSDERDQAQHHLEESDSATMEEDDSYGPPQDRNEEDFHLNNDLLFACVAVLLGLAAASCCFLLYVCIVGLENMVQMVQCNAVLLLLLADCCTVEYCLVMYVVQLLCFPNG